MIGQSDATTENTDGVRIHAAESLGSAADSVRSAGDQGAAAIGNLANGAGEALDSTAAYVRAFDGEDIVTGLRRSIRRHPVKSLALATAIGLVVGFSYRGGSRETDSE